MNTISKVFTFSASHQLTQLPADHPCARLHGHNYQVEFVLQGMPDRRGFVRDYREMDALKCFIDEEIDHRHIAALTTLWTFVTFDDPIGRQNEQIHKVLERPHHPPTAEHIARAFYEHAHRHGFKQVVAVRVSETPKTWATYSA